jgi:ankyrin repeat protein
MERLLAGGATLTLSEPATPRVRALTREDPTAVGRRSPDGWPPLHLAAHFGHGDAVDALLDSGHVQLARRLRGEMP